MRRIASERLLAPFGVFLLAFTLRCGYLAEIVDDPDFAAPLVDAGYHDYWAWGLASGDWTPPEGLEDPRIPSTPYFRPPLYPYFLAWEYAICGGRSYLGVRVIQALLGSLSCVLGFLLARRLFGSAAGILCGLIMAAWWPLVYFDSELREVALLVFLHLVLLLGLVAVRERRGRLGSLGCGLALGLSALAKPNALLFAPVAAGWLVLAPPRSVTWRRRWASCLAFLGGVVLAVAPATLRNAVAARDFVPVSSNGGINLWGSNNPIATGLSVELPDGPSFRSAFDYPAIVRHVERETGRGLKHSEVSRHFTRRAVGYIKDHPARCAALVWKKAVMFWNRQEVVSEKDLNAARRESLLLPRLPGNFAFLFAGGVVGGCLALAGQMRGGRWARRAHRADSGLLLLFIGLYFASFLPFFVTARYRVAIVPLLAALAAYAVVWTAERLAERRLIAGGLAICAMVGLCFLSSVNYYGYEADGFKAAFDRAYSLARSGRPRDARGWYERALHIQPDSPEAHGNLAELLVQEGKTDEAIEHYRTAIRLNPDYADGLYNLANALLQSGNPAEAADHYRRALRVRPDDARIHQNLGVALFALGQVEEAIACYRQALAIAPGSANAHYNLGRALDARGDRAVAAKHYTEALRLDPNHTGARRALDEMDGKEGLSP